VAILRRGLEALFALALVVAIIASGSLVVLAFAVSSTRLGKWAPGVNEETVWRTTAEQQRWLGRAMLALVGALAVLFACAEATRALPLP
jgi:hypothetical protein